MKIYTCLHLSHDCLMKNLIFTPTSSLLAIRILTFFFTIFESVRQKSDRK